MLRKIFIGFVIAMLILIAVLLFNTFTFKSVQLPAAKGVVLPAVSDSAITRLSQALQLTTVSSEDTTKNNVNQMLALHRFITTVFPLVHQHLQREVVNGYSLLYHWPGSNKTLKSAVLLAHMDVVPVEEETAAQWTVPPFSGTVKEGFIWGRGALDDKSSVLGTLEAVEDLLREGFRPQRDVYLAFGHDEEVGGTGAKAMALLLQQRGVHAEWVLDEGGALTQGIVPGINKPVALVGIAEKGYVTVHMQVNMTGGHSSMPHPEAATSVLAAAVVKLNKEQMPARLTPPLRQFVQFIGPEMPFAQKMAFANVWLFKPVLLNIYEGTPAGNALVRTTTAPTIFQSGVQDNVVPGEARAAINFRLLPGTTVQDVMAHVRRVVADDRVKLSGGATNSNAPPVSAIKNDAFQTLHQTIKEVFPDAVVGPSLITATTDARHYTSISNNVYRFLPVLFQPADLARPHGVNERIGTVAYKKAIQFYYRLLKNSCGQP